MSGIIGEVIIFQEDIKFISEKEDTKRESSTLIIPGVTKYMLTLLYISHVIWFCMMNIRVNVFNGTIVPQLMDIYPDNKPKGKSPPICADGNRSKIVNISQKLNCLLKFSVLFLILQLVNY